MIYLTTGANGAGKTLLTLRDVREKSLKENRPVYHNGRFEIAPNGPLTGWTKIDFKDWQTVPDGAIFLIDECHNEMPVRTGKETPDAIKMLAEHRRRGFDFYLITQHPNNIDAFVRRLIGSPGWHRHLKRASGAPLVSVLEWNAVNSNCEKAGSGESGSVKMVPYPKEVYNWYVSTSLDTAKIKVPFQLKVLIGVLLTVPVVVWYGWTTFKERQGATIKQLQERNQQAQPGQAAALPSAPGQTVKTVLTPAEYAASYAPRIEGLAYTAPRYDDLTRPVTVPLPAACVSMGTRCDCYTQQGTKLVTTKDVCLHIVKNGFFDEFAKPEPAAPPATEKTTGAPLGPTRAG